MILFRGILPVLFMLFFAGTAHAQINSVAGRVQDAAGNPYDGVYLTYDSTGSEISRGSFSGQINITGLKHHRLKLVLRSLLFRDTVFVLRYMGSPSHDLGKIVPLENQNSLAQVEVRSSPAMIRYSESGNLQVNVAGTILATSSSVNEILSRTPGVNVSEGIVSVQGKGEAIIYLNGSLITAERMASIPTSQITKIEIITNPSARYDASGRAVIQVTTKSPGGAGFNGKFNQYATYSSFAGTMHNSMVDLGYAMGKLSLSANLGVQLGKGRELLYTVRQRPRSADSLYSALSTDWKRKFSPFGVYGLSARYAVNRRSVFSLSFSGNRDQLGGSVNSQNVISTTSGSKLFSSSIDKDELRSNYIVLLDYNLDTDTLGSGVFLGGQYAGYSTGNEDYISESSVSAEGSPPRFLFNDAMHRLHIASLQLDRTKVFTKGGKLEFGFRFSAVKNVSDNAFLTSSAPSGPFAPSDELSSEFTYRETIGAGYASYALSIGKLQLSAGLRGEWTGYKMNSSALGEKQIRKDYFNIFPNLSATMSAGEVKLAASYASRITRPRYQALNPFVVYQDPFTTIEGNPELKPEKSQSVELSADYKGTVLKLGYTYTADQLTGSALRGRTPESYVLKSINISADYAFLVSLTKPFSVSRWWQSVNTTSLSYGKSRDDRYGFATTLTRPQLYLYSSNTFSLGYGIKLQLLAWFMGDRYYSLRHDDKRSMVTLGVEKSLLQNKLKIGFTANDIFDKYIAAGDYNVGQTQIYYNRTYGFKYYRLTASYSFGGDQKPAERRKPSMSENNRAN